MDQEWLAPSPKMWRARLLELLVVTGALTIAAAVIVDLTIDAAAAGVAIAVILAAAAVMSVVLRRRFLAWGYAERDDDLLVRRGVMVKRMTVVPYGRMQFVDVTAGPVDRVYGLSTVQLHTAAAASDARIPGLERVDAERLRDRLAALGEAKAAGL